MSVNEKMTALADAIREKTGGTAPLTLDGMASAIKGIETGGGYDEGYEAGKQAEYDAFWDTFQQNGERLFYTYAFANCWNSELFKPKYDIKPTQAGYMFRDSGIEGDFAELLERLGVVLDTSNCTDLTQAFRGMKKITRLPVIDCSRLASASINYLFCENDSLEIIDKIILSTTKPPTFTSTFSSNYKMTEVRFEGVITNVIDFHWSPLSHDSIINNDGTGIINVLQDFSGTTTTKALTLGTANLAKLTDAEKAIATQKGWSLA